MTEDRLFYVKSLQASLDDLDKILVEDVRQEPAMVPGGTAAPELFMKPVDVSDEAVLSGWMQLKVDGIGAGALAGRVITPQGSMFDAALHCLPALVRMEERIGRPSVIIGEYAEEAGYDATMSSFKRGKGTGTFWAYDVVPFSEWLVDRCTQPIEERLQILHDAVWTAADSNFVGMLKAWEIDEPWRALEETKHVWSLGYEGTVAKKRRSLYTRRRSPDWVRLKETITVDVLVTDVLHRNGRLHALICKDPASPLPPITVTSGWNDREAGILGGYDALPPGDRWIEIAYNKKAGDVRPRHARFVRVRLAKKGG